MTNILPFKRPTPTEKHKGKTLCKSGFHKWKIKIDRKFEVREGKLLTQLICERCGAEKTEMR